MAEPILTTITVSLLASACYDILKESGKITMSYLTQKFPILSKNMELAEVLSDEIKGMDQNADSIIQQIELNEVINETLQKINSSGFKVNQTHYGSGDNVLGNKIIYK